MARLLFVLMLVSAMVPVVYAQQVQVRTVEQSNGGAVYEVTASWASPLKAVLDSTGLSTLSEELVLAASRGHIIASASLDLPALSQPNVRVISSDYDEVSLTRSEVNEEVLAELTKEPAEVVGLGIARKKAMGTLHSRLLGYDADRSVLRRYRRMVVRVDYSSVRASTQLSAARQSAFSNPHLSVDRSVLADGIVYKIAIPRGADTIFRIDRDYLSSLPGLELDPANIDPASVKVYGNGGAPVPALNGTPRLADLAENPVLVQGGGDGSFDAGDAVLFYARGPEGWNVNVERNSSGAITDVSWEHYVHPFSEVNYYFIKIDDNPSTPISEVSFPDFSSPTTVSEIRGRHFVDFDEFMWARERGGTGHTFVSNLIALGGGERIVLNNETLPGMTSGTVEYEARPAIQSNPSASVFFSSGGTRLATANFGGVANNPESIVARSRVISFEEDVSNGAALNLTMQLQNAPGSPKAALDWLRVFYPKSLQADNGRLRFHTPLNETGQFEYVLSGFSTAPQVWDITDPGEYKQLAVRNEGGTYRVQVAVSDGLNPRELLAYTADAIQRLDAVSTCPEQDCRVAPQNLHGIQSFPDFVIVTPTLFKPYADELAERRRQEGLVVEVALIDHIFNEFSGGMVDMRAIRDYFKFLYDRSGDNEDLMLRYALLFGDGHYNFREIGEEPALANWIPPYETQETFDPETSYTTDDYFGLLDDNEGLWPYTRRNFTGDKEHLNERVDLGVGRLTIQTETEARGMLDKIKRYESADTYAPWRSRYLFLADDALNGLAGTDDDGDLHTQNTDVVAELVEGVAPAFDQQKIYAISYRREFLNGWRIPDAHKDIISSIHDGVLLVNYSGHGGENGLAQENIFTREDAKALQNGEKLPIFITATCSFGRWDMAEEQSGAEELLLNPDGGAIALLTTVRTVYTTGFSINTLNVGLNMALNRELFKPDEDGLPRRLGDALRLTKNTQVGYEGNNRKFNLLGDPTMRVGMASHKAVVNSINDLDVNNNQAQLPALERITLTGQIQDPSGNPATSFNGVVNISVFDVRRNVTLPVQRFSDKPYYTVREDLIWRGKVNATNGVFDATFVVPKDISYSNLQGRISVYASSEFIQAQGYTENVIVGGTAANPPNDKAGPVVELFLNDETFVDGGLTTIQPTLIVKLFDDSGINTVGAGVGHEMLLVVDGNEQQALNIGDLYESEENSYQRGRVTYTFDEALDPGPHTLSVKAWDVLNNSNSAELGFVVTESENLVVENVFNYPNPTPGQTRFIFEHNQPLGTPVTVQIRIYTLNGQAVKTIEQDDVLSAGPMQIHWDGLDDDFDRLASGIYLYKVRVEVEGDEGDLQVSEHLEKLAIIR